VAKTVKTTTNQNGDSHNGDMPTRRQTVKLNDVTARATGLHIHFDCERKSGLTLT